jgi:predicted permease
VNVTLDWRVAAFTLALSICTGVLSGLAPAWQSSSVDLSSALKPTTRGSRTRALLVTAEIALAVVLSIGAALLIRSFISIRHVNPGFDPRDVVVMRVSLAGPRFAKAADASRVIQESTRRLRAIPGVESVASSCCVPLDTRIQAGFEIPGRPPGPASQGVTGRVSASAGYFETLHIPLLRGRTFTQRDETGPPAAIVNETFANQFWPDGDALNGRLKIGGDPLAIVGIAADVRDRGLNRDPRPTVYIASSSPGGLLRLMPWAWIIRTRGAPAPWIPQIEKELREATGGLPAGSIRTMQDIVARSTAAGDFNTLVMTIFGASALLLAAIGVYGLMAHSVAERVREIGIRLALGARSREIRRMILFEGLRIIGPGVVLGAAAGFGLTRLMSALLFGVQTHDPLVFSIAPLVLAAAGIIAVWLPAARASRVEPAIALRHE